MDKDINSSARQALPDDFTILWRGSRQPTRALEELAGSGLVTLSGTVAAA